MNEPKSATKTVSKSDCQSLERELQLARKELELRKKEIETLKKTAA